MDHISKFPVRDTKFYGLICEEFTRANKSEVDAQLLQWLGFKNGDETALQTQGIILADCKSEYWIMQKYEEYRSEYIHGGAHVFKKFKDLFRASISFETFMHVKDRFTNLPVVSVKPRREGNYRAVYIILNVLEWNYELKVVKDIESFPESHEWYELRRNSSKDNLDIFIRRHLKFLQKRPDILNDRVELLKDKKYSFFLLQ